MASVTSTATALAAATAITWPGFADQSFFSGLGQLPGGQSGSVARAISGDGQVVIGISAYDGGSSGYRWTRSGGMVALPPEIWPADVSADGAIIVGNSGAQAARWTQEAGVELLGTLNGDAESRAVAISGDGSTIVGTSTFIEERCCTRFGYPYFYYEYHAFVLGLNGNLRALNPPPSFDYASVSAVSADGAVIAGSSGAEYGPYQACIWVNRHPVELGPGGASAVSADGSVVLGRGGWDAFRWTDAGGMQALCWPATPVAVSADGSVIIANDNDEALLWDAEHGLRPLQRALVNEFGLDLTGWSLRSAVDISDDGRTIVGTGTNPAGRDEAWIAVLGDRLPPLPPCPGDLNGDSVIDLGDLAVLLAHFGTPDGATHADGDLDRDGDVDLSDLAALLAGFGTTCPGVPGINLSGLGFLPGGSTSYCNGISGDGSVIAGTGHASNGLMHAFRWTEATGIVDLGMLPGTYTSYAHGISGDGSVIVGRCAEVYAVRWTVDGGVENLGTVPDGYTAVANGTNFDGSVIVGSGNTANGYRAFRWTSAGMVNLGALPGGSESYALAVSADGTTVIGGGNTPESRRRAFRWTSAGMDDLGALPGFETSLALAVSEDGSVVVGESGPYESSPKYAFRWTRAGGMVNLGTLPGDTSSSAGGVSPDGDTVYGTSYGPGGGRTFRWTPALGMVDLSPLVLAPEGWFDFGIGAISADGLTAAGGGIHCGQNEAWIAQLGELPPP